MPLKERCARNALPLVDANVLVHLQRRYGGKSEPGGDGDASEEESVELLVARRDPISLLGTITSYQGGFVDGFEGGDKTASLDTIASQVSKIARKLAAGGKLTRGQDGRVRAGASGRLSSHRSIGASAGSPDGDDGNDSVVRRGSSMLMLPKIICCFWRCSLDLEPQASGTHSSTSCTQ